MGAMGSALTTIGLPVALGIIMFGLGLSLTPSDFARVAKHPRAVIIALVCQLLLLPALCFGLVLLFRLPPVLAVGMMLLAASPGGTTANLYSHLFRGDVALNISLTAINSVIAVFTLPLFTNVALALFLPESDEIGLQFSKAVQVFAIVLVPVLIGIGILLVIFGPRLQAWTKSRHEEGGSMPTSHLVALMAGVLVAGVYGGYFGAAQGVLLLGIMSILLPLGLVSALPALVNFSIILTKETVILSIITVPELMYQVSRMSTETFRYVEANLVLALFFVFLNLIVDLAQAAIDPRIKRS